GRAGRSRSRIPPSARELSQAPPGRSKRPEGGTDMRKALIALALAPLVLAAAACSNGGGGSASSSSGDGGVAIGARDAAGVATVASPIRKAFKPGNADAGRATSSVVPEIGPKIVRTASVELSVRRGRFDGTV